MSRHADGMRLALIAGRPTPTNEALCRARIAGTGWELLTPQEALDALRPGDGVLGRLDVLPTLDGVEDGLWALGALAAREVRVLNDRAALLSAHDKLLTARLLRRCAIAHPVTSHARAGRVPPLFTGPVVVKPRFGSGGSGVCLCDDADSLAIHWRGPPSKAGIDATGRWCRSSCRRRDTTYGSSWPRGGWSGRCTGSRHRGSGGRMSLSAPCGDRSPMCREMPLPSQSPPQERSARLSSASTCFRSKTAGGPCSS